MAPGLRKSTWGAYACALTDTMAFSECLIVMDFHSKFKDKTGQRKIFQHWICYLENCFFYLYIHVYVYK